MSLPTENVGSLPRPAVLQAAIASSDPGEIEFAELSALHDAACKEAVERMEATTAPHVSDGAQGAPTAPASPIPSSRASPRRGQLRHARSVQALRAMTSDQGNITTRKNKRIESRLSLIFILGLDPRTSASTVLR